MPLGADGDICTPWFFTSIPDDYHLSLISRFRNYIVRKNNGMQIMVYKDNSMQVMVCKGPPLHQAHHCWIIRHSNNGMQAMVCK